MTGCPGVQLELKTCDLHQTKQKANFTARHSVAAPGNPNDEPASKFSQIHTATLNRL